MNGQPQIPSPPEDILKFEFASPNITEMDKMDQFTFAKIFDYRRNVGAHQGKITLAHGNAIARAWT